MGQEEYLEPQYDARKSFYRKARVVVEGKMRYLYSYSTKVASYNTETDELEIHGFYSQTTTRHIRDFIYQYCHRSWASYSIQKLRENFTVSGRKEVEEKEKAKEEKRIERENAKLLKLRIKEAEKHVISERKLELKKQLSELLGSCYSKSEINTFVKEELEGEMEELLKKARKLV